MTRPTPTAFATFWKRCTKYGKVLIFLDNASYHKSVGVRETLEKYDGGNRSGSGSSGMNFATNECRSNGICA